MNQGVQNNSNIRLVIAGPGGGKTHNMVGEILNSIETLSPTRHCAVITYTNAATENIKARIENKIAIPQNIFIGTTHSFLIKFIFEPFAHLFDITSVDKHYIDAVKLSYSAKNTFAKKNGEITLASNLLYILTRKLSTFQSKSIPLVVTMDEDFSFFKHDKYVYETGNHHSVLPSGKKPA